MDENGNDVAEQRFGLSGNSFTLLGSLWVGVSQPPVLYEGTTIRAVVDTDIKDVELTYKWTKNDGTPLGTGAELTLQGHGYNVQLEVTATVPGKTSVTRKVKLLSSIMTVQPAAYSVSVDYENENLIITPLGENTFTEVRVTVKDTTITKTINPADKSLAVSLEPFQLDKFQVDLEVLNGSTKLSGPELLSFTRAAADVRGEDFTIDVAPPAQARAARNVNVSCNAPEKYEKFRIKQVNYVSGTAATIESNAGDDVAVEARIPGSNEACLLPSVWSNAATIEGSKWLHLFVDTEGIISQDAMFWGEKLSIKTNLDAADLKWKINGTAVDAPALENGQYIIPVGTSSLSITSEDETDSFTREFSDIRSPLNVSLDYVNEWIVLETDGNCMMNLEFSIGSQPVFVLLYGQEVNENLSDFGYPTDQEHVLTVTVELPTGNLEIPLTIPARFAGSPAYGSVEVCDLRYAPYYSNENLWEANISTTDSDSVKYTDVKIVDSSGKEIHYHWDNGDDKWLLPSSDSLSGDTIYRIYAMQCSVDADGKQNSFHSEWFDTGVSFTPCPLSLSTTKPLVGDTLNAWIPINTAEQLPEGVIGSALFKWYSVNSNGDCTEIDVGPSFMILPGRGYENCRLRAVAFAGGKALGYAETEVIPAPEIVIKCDGTELKKILGGTQYIAYFGDKLTAEVKNASDALDRKWSWLKRGDSSSICDTASMEVDINLCNSLTGTVNLTLGSGDHAVTLTRNMRFNFSPPPEVTIDYENEALVAVRPDNLSTARCNLRVSCKHPLLAAVFFSNENKFTVPIASIQSDWPGNQAYTVQVQWTHSSYANGAPVGLIDIALLLAYNKYG